MLTKFKKLYYLYRPYILLKYNSTLDKLLKFFISTRYEDVLIKLKTRLY